MAQIQVRPMTRVFLKSHLNGIDYIVQSLAAIGTSKVTSASKETMPTEHSIPEDSSRRKIIVVVAVIAAGFIGAFFFLLLRKTVRVCQSPRLENANRPGSPDWDKNHKMIPLDDPEAGEAKRWFG